ncbi:MAG: glycosyltransferase [Microcella pacifica]|uniref:glycosyltransferase n=1 Tax=Microcella pacifica TaxID=2591847 RepID=UPI0033162378
MLKQVALFSKDYAVTTCGFGEAPAGVATHHRVPTGYTAARPYSRLLRLRLFRLAYWRQSAVRWARKALRGGHWEAVIANDPESLPLAFAVAPRSIVHADLHEYSPRMREHLAGWSRIYRPYYEWLCRRFVARATSRTTVSRGLADEYRRVFGAEVEIVTNAAPFAALQPTPTSLPLRLVHSGGAMQNRGLEELVEAMHRVSTPMTLDLYLVPSDPALIERLRAAAGSTVTFHEAVPYTELARTLNSSDIGVFLLPPRTFSYAHALPNKFFDFVQARLAIVVGPTPEMAELVEDHRLGWVTEDFSVDALVAVLDSLGPDSVDAAKSASHAAAELLSAEQQSDGWRTAVTAIARLKPAGYARLAP